MHRFATDEGVPAPLQRPLGRSILACRRYCLQRYLVVDEIADGAIELGCKGALEHHREIVAVLPVRFSDQLFLDQLIEARPGQRIRDTDADIVRSRQLQQGAGRQDVRELLVQITQLDEKPNANTGSLETLPTRHDLRDGSALVHGIQLPLAAALRAQPRLPAASGCW